MLIAWHFSGNSSPVDQRDQEDGQIDEARDSDISVIPYCVTSGGASFSSGGGYCEIRSSNSGKILHIGIAHRKFSINIKVFFVLCGFF